MNRLVSASKPLLKECSRHRSDDGTVKVLWSLHDGHRIESVVIHHSSRRPTLNPDRMTLCVSSQAGCAMGCGFCFTARQNLTRNLTEGEILGQISELSTEFPITNLVFMGMGEPLHNFDHVTGACRELLNRDHSPFSRRKILISTSGLVPGIRKLADQAPVRLAVSLNASNDETRSRLMPVNRKWGIEELLAAAEEHARRVRMPAMLEYVLIRDVNDLLEDAARLRVLAQDRPFQVNLIPFNEFSESEFKRPDAARIKAFQHHLVSQGITTTVRFSGGNDILAACGQLTGRAASGEQQHHAVL